MVASVLVDKNQTFLNQGEASGPVPSAAEPESCSLTGQDLSLVELPEVTTVVKVSQRQNMP